MRLLPLLTLLLLFSCNPEPKAKYYITDNYGYRYYTDAIKDNDDGCIFFTSKHGYTEGMIIKLCGYNSIIEDGKTRNTR